MRIIRTIWLLVIIIAFWPIILLFAGGWLILCIRSAKLLSETIMDGFRTWCKYIKVGIEMNKEFIINGINGY